jgi:hypothetical protein
VAEKLSALQTAEFFADRKARADFEGFDKLMKRRGGKPPRAGDEMPGSKAKASSRVCDTSSWLCIWRSTEARNQRLLQ